MRRVRAIGPSAAAAGVASVLLAAALVGAAPRTAAAQDVEVPDADARRPVPAVVTASDDQAAFEEALIDAIRPDSLRRWARGLASRTHVAGTPGQRATRDSVIGWMRAAGIEASYDSLILYLPHPLLTELSQTAPVVRTFDLIEPPLFGTDYEHVPQFSAYGGDGVAQAEVVYVNYGLPADYAVLDSLGVDVAGRIALARYGRSFRGIKAREAEARGAAGLLLYSDPAADGFARGAVLPDGPYRPPRGVQRGSVLNADGDPSTPGRPSRPGAERVPESEMKGVARIPVLPIGYGAAEDLLRALEGPPPPEDWRGALDVGYRPGPGPSAVRMAVRFERGEDAYHAAHNTIAVIPGALWPDEWVIAGAHRDSWGPGAVDNVSGTASVVAAARAFAEAARRGFRPARTLVFGTWDAEEWGILGSTEWVEGNADVLRSAAVAYVNQDSPVSGDRFGASAAPELRGLLRATTRAVTDPRTGRPVFDAWLEQQRERLDRPVERPVPGTMGGGSDHLPFYIHLGVPATGFGFGGQGGVYHSMYDTPEWMERYGDPEYRHHAATAQLTAVLLARLANAPVIPYGHEALATAFRTELAGLAGEIERAGLPADPGLEGALEAVRGSLGRYEDAARRFSVSVERWPAGDGRDATALAAVNEAQRNALLALTRTGPGAGWSRNLYVRDDPDNGYSPLVLPGPRLALRAGDASALAEELALLAEHFDRAAEALGEGRRRIEGRPLDRGGGAP
ncbi:MAG: M20/M25/M40 family metallo-hydrolase [Gemmatimonadota bacterium]